MLKVKDVYVSHADYRLSYSLDDPDDVYTHIINLRYDRLNEQGETIDWYDADASIELDDTHPIVQFVQDDISCIIWEIDQGNWTPNLTRKRRGRVPDRSLSQIPVNNIRITQFEVKLRGSSRGYHQRGITEWLNGTVYNRVDTEGKVIEGLDGGIFIKVNGDEVKFDHTIISLQKSHYHQLFTIFTRFWELSNDVARQHEKDIVS